MNKTEVLIEKLTHMLNAEGGESSVSPTSRLSGEVNTLPGGPYIHKDMNVEQLTQNEKLMVHVLLHKFYASGHRDLSKEDIEQLHGKLIKDIPHKMFDRLDKK